MSDPVTCSTIFQKHIPARLTQNPQLAELAHGVYEFTLSGSQGGVWTLDLNSFPPLVITGKHANPDVRVEMSDRDFVDYMQGRLNGTLAFIQGRIRLRGDIQLAMQMGKLIGRL